LTRQISVTAIIIRADNRDFRVVNNADLIADIRYGTADFAMPGSDLTNENPNWAGLDAEEVDKLRDCEFVFATDKNMGLDLNRAVRVATSYEKTTIEGIDVIGREIGLMGLENYRVIKRAGKVEGSVPGLADAIVDVRQTGKSLERNNLVERVSLGHIMLCGLWRMDTASMAVI